MNTLSMFAATTCSVVSSPAAWRVNSVRRGRIARSTASDWGVAGVTAAQSPTAGARSRLGTMARTEPSAANVVQAPRSTRETRAGIACSSVCCSNASRHWASQPSSSRRASGSAGVSAGHQGDVVTLDLRRWVIPSVGLRRSAARAGAKGCDGPRLYRCKL